MPVPISFSFMKLVTADSTVIADGEVTLPVYKLQDKNPKIEDKVWYIHENGLKFMV
jgi:hypothetical protein